MMPKNPHTLAYWRNQRKFHAFRIFKQTRSALNILKVAEKLLSDFYFPVLVHRKVAQYAWKEVYSWTIGFVKAVIEGDLENNLMNFTFLKT